MTPSLVWGYWLRKEPVGFDSLLQRAFADAPAHRGLRGAASGRDAKAIIDINGRLSLGISSRVSPYDDLSHKRLSLSHKRLNSSVRTRVRCARRRCGPASSPVAHLRRVAVVGAVHEVRGSHRDARSEPTRRSKLSRYLQTGRTGFVVVLQVLPFAHGWQPPPGGHAAILSGQHPSIRSSSHPLVVAPSQSA